MLIRNNLFSNSACIYHEIKHNLSQEEFEGEIDDSNSEDFNEPSHKTPKGPMVIKHYKFIYIDL